MQDQGPGAGARQVGAHRRSRHGLQAARSVPTPRGQRPLPFVHLTDKGGPRREASSLSLCL